jgi:hypothetical protein
MKYLFLVGLFLAGSTACFAQDKIPPTDKSPLDISYYPSNYPQLKVQEKVTGQPIARLIYSRPGLNGRVVFGDLIEYGKVWRLGANEATELECFQDLLVNKQRLKKGRYTLYAVPDPTEWTIIISKENDTWGAFRYDAKKEILRTKLPVEKLTDAVETFSMYFDSTAKGFGLVIIWENAKVTLPLEVAATKK